MRRNWRAWPTPHVVGDGLDAATQMGPLQNKTQFEKVKEFLEDARLHGKIIAGGKALPS